MLKLLYPDVYLSSLFHLDLDLLKQRDIRAILFDLDNTIVPRDGEKLEPAVEKWLQDLLKQGFSLAVVSNNGYQRVNALIGSLSIPAVARAVKPMKRAFKKAMRLLNVEGQNTAVLGDQIFTDILGGNRLKLFTILVQPLEGREFWATSMFNRRLERSVLRDIDHQTSGEKGCFLLK